MLSPPQWTYVPGMRFLLFILVFWALAPVAARADMAPAPVYFPVMPFDAPPDSSPQLVPLAVNFPLEGVHSGVTQAVILIHDDSRDALTGMSLLRTLAGNQNASTAIIAPQFLLPSDIMRFVDYLPAKGKQFATWPIVGWTAGDNSISVSGRKSVSSFTVIDLLAMYLSQREAFPDLLTIVVAGYGAGGNFVQRYAAFSAAYEPVSKSGVEMRFLVANAKSFLYMTPSRPVSKRGFGLPDKAACPEYNDYPFGLFKLNPYTRHVGVNAAKLEYGTRYVTYLNASASNAPLDTDCPTLAQGPSSAARAESYQRYLSTLYGDQARRTQTFVRISGPNYDAVALFGSPCGMSVLFGNGRCVAAPRGIME
ncbi:MAG: hypothetical protein PHE27_03300 [Alphaproteobacteria bacterium]|nr:hypothetical protein [Alphaproteobacteria bacterium]